MSKPGDGGVWFEYAQRPGKFSARPVHAKGWAALWSVGGLSPPLLIGAILLANLAAFFILWRLVLARGRRLV